MKKAFVIIGYVNTPKKEQVLKNLILKLQKCGVPIILSMSNFPSKEILDMVDNFILDKENPLLVNYKETSAYTWLDLKTLKVKSLYNASLWYNAGMCVYKLMLLGLQTAKTLGYERVQLFNYDTEILKYDEINDNFHLLNSCDVVGYKLNDHKNRFFCYPQYLGFNLKNFSHQELDYNFNKKSIKEEFKVFIHNGMFETIFSNLVIRPKNYFLRNKDFLKNQINIDVINPTTEDTVFTVVPFMKDGKVHVVMYNVKPKDDLPKGFTIRCNKSSTHNHIIPASGWHWIDTSLSLEDIKTIDVFINDKFIVTYDFINEIDKNHFKEHSICKTGDDDFWDEDHYKIYGGGDNLDKYLIDE